MKTKIIESEFESLRAIAFPSASGVELEERRKMFFAGFASCLSSCSDGTDAEIEQHVIAVNQELDEFNNELQKAAS